ncbi:hypothetical protein GGF43_004447 [Coemansia sp. RSA 2618]|nr:hypothetical protein GGF43_004447 [Coemansia sp. RSA 2618]
MRLQWTQVSPTLLPMLTLTLLSPMPTQPMSMLTLVPPMLQMLMQMLMPILMPMRQARMSPFLKLGTMLTPMNWLELHPTQRFMQRQMQPQILLLISRLF